MEVEGLVDGHVLTGDFPLTGWHWNLGANRSVYGLVVDGNLMMLKDSRHKGF